MSMNIQRRTFNSRPHKEVDNKRLGHLSGENLSIHDLTRRSTIEKANNNGDCIIFQFTTSQGGRRAAVSTERRKGRPFNSRPHKEVDLGSDLKFTATSPFNSRPHKEVDHCSNVRIIFTVQLSIHDLTRRSTRPL